MKQLKFAIVSSDHISQILFYLAHNRAQNILGIFASDREKHFYEFAITNLKYSNIECRTFSEISQNSELATEKVAVIMSIPTTFEIMQKLLKDVQKSSQIVVVLMKQNKKYINMIKKKIGGGQLEVITAEYSVNDLVGINRKLRDLVDKSYDMNRAAFYAYGAYLNNYRANLLKFIFKTQDVDVAALAKSYGFNTPPRVKQGSFLKVSARKDQIKQKLKQKKMIKKQKQVEENQKVQEVVNPQNKKSSIQRIKQIAAKKTKKIFKEKQSVKAKIQQKVSQKPATQQKIQKKVKKIQ